MHDSPPDFSGIPGPHVACTVYASPIWDILTDDNLLFDTMQVFWLGPPGVVRADYGGLSVDLKRTDPSWDPLTRPAPVRDPTPHYINPRTNKEMT